MDNDNDSNSNVLGFDTDSLMGQLKGTGFLIKNSFTIFGREDDLKTPIIFMVIYSLVLVGIGVTSLILLFSGRFILGFVGLGISFFLLMYRFLFDVNQQAAMSWLTYKSITGEDITLDDSYKHLNQDTLDLFGVALVDLVMAIVGTQKEKEGGILQFIINLIISALEEVWDLVQHYLIPAIVIEEKSLEKVVEDMKKLKNNIPATLTGVFGIDFVGDAVAGLVSWGYFLLIVLGATVGYFFGSTIGMITIPIGNKIFSFVPLIVAFGLMAAIGESIKRVVKGIKAIYFTIFYTTIMRKEEIDPELKDELISYLKMKNNEEK